VQRQLIAARNCAFHQENKEIYLQLMSTATSTEVKKEALTWASCTTPLTIARLISFARLEEAASSQRRQLVKRNKPHPPQQGTTSAQQPFEQKPFQPENLRYSYYKYTLTPCGKLVTTTLD